MSVVFLVAGGTGGHINAALALGEKLQNEFGVIYLTGKRPLDYKLFHGKKVIHLDSKPLRTSNPIILFKNIMSNLFSFIFLLLLFLKKRPKFILGAGGYVCGPSLLAGFILFIPVFIIEQNAVMGLTNKILGWISKIIFVHFTETKGLSESLSKKVKVVGNPTRSLIQPVKHKKFQAPLKLFVFGGSLGANQINEVIWNLIKEDLPFDLEIHHQVGVLKNVPNIESKFRYVPMEYVENMQAEYDWCDVIISRAGASTISELAVIRKPALIFPYPQATDNHQYFNAIIFQKESDFTVEVLDPKIREQESLERVKEFLFKASSERLKYTQIENVENKSCDHILREIKLHVGLV
jgi:UDP-N-acetylglucosamine--N-acetylmuramyl-(pentapeptide) pyrophosphoryl-undecaprenol N-acetylglucosamine transferase